MIVSDNDLDNAFLLQRVRFLERQLYFRPEINMKEDRDFLIMVSYLELTDRESYIKINNLMKYFCNKKLLQTNDLYEKEILTEFIKSPIKFHDFDEEQKKFIFDEAEKIYEKGSDIINDEEKVRLEKISEKADLFASLIGE